MQINEQINDLLRKKNINLADAIVYLLSIYYNQKPCYIPDGLKRKVNSLKIVEYDNVKGKHNWRIPLFQQDVRSFDWVLTEYLPIFEPFGKENTYKNECVKRMETLFRENPTLTKDAVLDGTKYYIYICKRERRNPQYVSSPHYFIEKGMGRTRTNAVLTFIEMAQEERKKLSKIANRQSKSVTMQ